jgi:Kef-type K+ transport system membrane component KefB
MGLVLAAIATSSAPAAILAIIHECRAAGPLTTTTLATLLITDALAVLTFPIALGVAQSMGAQNTHVPFQIIMIPPLLQIGKSIVIGGALALPLVLASRVMKGKSALLGVLLALIFLCIGLNDSFGGCSILSNMVLGLVAVNLTPKGDTIQLDEEFWPLVYTVFFVVNGMNFDLSEVKQTGLLTVLVITGRWLGKYGGARFGARVSGASKEIERYVGLVLLPKAGLTLGLALSARNSFGTFGHILFNALVASTMVNMLVTSLLAKYSIGKCGERFR